MTPPALLTVGREALLLMVLASMPPVLAGLVVGVGMGLLQALEFSPGGPANKP